MKHLGLILVLSILLSLVTPGILVRGEDQTILVVRKEIRFNITVIAGPDDNGTVRTVILVLDFYFINAQPSNSDVNISFPVMIRIGDKIINKTVVVPLRIRGELEKIVVVSAGEATPEPSSGEESSEEIIVYYPGSTGPTANNTTSPGQTESSGGSSGVAATRTVTKTITKTKTITMGAVPGQQGTTTQPTTSPRVPGAPSRTESTGTEYADILFGVLLGGLLGAVLIIVLIMVLMRRRPPSKTRQVEAPTTPQQTQQVVQPETPVSQGEKRLQIPRLKCPVCGETIEPIVTDDNRLVCPACHAEIGRIREDGTLELATPEEKTMEETEQ